jgi:hypothetical protein
MEMWDMIVGEREDSFRSTENEKNILACWIRGDVCMCGVQFRHCLYAPLEDA